MSRYRGTRLLAMVSVVYLLWPIGDVVVQGYGLYGPYGLWITACADLGKGCAVNTFFMEISNLFEIPCAAQSLRSTVNWLMAWRSAVGAAS